MNKKTKRINIKTKSPPSNPNRRKMSVDMSDTLSEVKEMNKKALKILAKMQ